MLLAAAGCAPSTAGAQPVPGAPCGSAAGPSAGSALPFGLIDVSAVPATRQAWALAEHPAGRFTPPKRGNYLLHFSGLNWTKVVTFRRDIEVKGVSAVSATAAWVWGDEGRAGHSSRPFLALVSDGAARQMRTPLLSDVYVSSIASDGTADTWLAGSRYRNRRFLGEVVARWDGTSWYRVAAPAGARAVWPQSTSGSSDAWAVVTRGFAVNPWLVHWDGASWSSAYRPPASLAREGRVPMDMSAALMFSIAGVGDLARLRKGRARLHCVPAQGVESLPCHIKFRRKRPRAIAALCSGSTAPTILGGR